jgi:ParB-like chromosome segregation protein Spo0J
VKLLTDYKTMKFCGYDIHPIAAKLPMLSGSEWNSLLASIRECGQLDPIVLDGDVLIDGRNRLKACLDIGIQPNFIQWADMAQSITQAQWIKAKNLDRRHLTDEQRVAFIAACSLYEKEQEAAAAKVAGLKIGSEKPVTQKSESREKDRNERSTAGKIAKEANVSRYKAEQAIKLAKAAEESPEAAAVQQKVIAGEMPLAEGVRETSTPKPKEPKEAKREPQKRGSYADWQKFRTLCIQLEEAIDELSGLRVDAPHDRIARDTAAKICRKLEKVINNI